MAILIFIYFKKKKSDLLRVVFIFTIKLNIVFNIRIKLFNFIVIFFYHSINETLFIN